MSKKDARERAVGVTGGGIGLKEHIQNNPGPTLGRQSRESPLPCSRLVRHGFLDEPTSGAWIPELITEVLAVHRATCADGMTDAMATHQIGFASDLADEILFLEMELSLSRPPGRILSQAECVREPGICSKLTGSMERSIKGGHAKVGVKTI